jgi:hypothetical protein
MGLRGADEISVKSRPQCRCEAVLEICRLMWGSGNRKACTVAALLISALALGGCATSIADMPLVGVPADAPARPKEVGAYPAVHDLPAAREQDAMDPGEQAKIQKELLAARDRQAAVAADKGPPAGKSPAAADKNHSAAKSKAKRPPREAKAEAITGVGERP